MDAVEILIQNPEQENAYDITQIVNSISVSTYLELKPGKLDLSLKPLDNMDWVELGSLITVKVGKEKLFFGYIFKFDINQDRAGTLTAYDQMRYLQNKDTMVTKKATASDIFAQVCNAIKLNYSLVAKSEHILAQRINDNKTYGDMIVYALDKTLIDANLWYFIRDNWGTLEFLDLYDERTNMIIGDTYSLSSYAYTTSIDNDTYNQIKLVKENKETQKREIYIEMDSSTINKWGTLQFYETVQEDMSDAQIRSRADTLLEYYNKPKRTLKLGKCLGNFGIKAGRSFKLKIDDLKDAVPYDGYVICSSCTHSIDNDTHFMELEVLI